MKQEAPVCGERDREVSAWVAAQATNTCTIRDARLWSSRWLWRHG